MKITHFLLATLFFVMSCTSEQKSANETKVEDEKPLKVKISVPKEKVPVDKSTVDEAMRQLAKKAQNFTIEADKDKTIICAEGTKITLKANSLVDEKTGKPVQGKVNVKITEYYKISDIIIASLSTTSNDKLLETAGMINIEAFSNGKKLRLKDGATAQISFPTKKKKEGMKLFNGEWKNGVVNWVLSDVKNQNNESKNAENVFTVVDQMPVFPGGDKAFMEFLRTNLVYPAYPKDAGIMGTVYVSCVIDVTGAVTSIGISKGVDIELNTEAVRVVSLLPKFSPAKVNGQAVAFRLTIPISFRLRDKEGSSSATEIKGGTSQDNRFLSSEELKASIEAEKKGIAEVQKNRKQLIKKGLASVSDVNFYLLYSSKLAWINCDRFISTKNKVVYEVFTKESVKLIVYLIFKNERSVLAAYELKNGRYQVASVPLDEPISIVAIKSENGKTYIATKDTKISKEGESNLEFKLATLKELKKVLEGLDR